MNLKPQYLAGINLAQNNLALLSLPARFILIRGFGPCLVRLDFFYHPSHRMFRHMHEVINIYYLQN